MRCGPANAFRGDTLYFSQETVVRRLDPGAVAPVTVVSGIPAGGEAPSDKL